MALKNPVESGHLTQSFGPSQLVQEPAMFATARSAWWNAFRGASYHPHFHPALDISAVEGTPILASEDGTVIDSYYDTVFGGGNKVRVQIRPGVYYTSNHMRDRSVGVGAHVKRGQVLGHVGSTGNSTGPHDHFEVGFDDRVGSETWPRLWNPQLFLRGGAMANDPRIQPQTRHVVLNGPGINIRGSRDFESADNIFATSRPDGIFRRRDGKRIAPLAHQFEFVRLTAFDGIQAVRVVSFGRALWIAKSLVHFV